MRMQFQGQFQMIPRQLMRRAGYAEFIDPRTRKVSYVRRLQPGRFYPRFHVYIDDRDDGFVVNLHLDQKQASYKGCNMHSGEYDSEVVMTEGERVRQVIGTMKA
ncbi:hypothetical protein H6758_01425 [Candidatus Nomurabacteria bacterium]|nr:hypothetical protein [Candidatus Nomurabacteria bacterium]